MALSDKDAKKIADTIAKAMKGAEKLEATYAKAGKQLGSQAKVWTSVTEQLFGLGQSAFFDKLEHSEDYVQQLNSELQQAKENIDKLGVTLDKSFNTALNALPAGFEEKLFKQIDKFVSVKSPEMGAALRAAMETGNLTDYIKDFGEEGVEVFKKLIKGKHGATELRRLLGKEDGMVKQMQDMVENAKDLHVELEKDGQEFMSWKNTLGEIGRIMTEDFKFANIKNSLMDFDQTLAETQRDTGIAFKDNSLAFTDLTVQSARFGLSVKETSELMGKLGAGLRTTDFGILSKAAEDMAAISKATGISIDDIGELGSQMMLFGKTSEDVSKFAEDTMKSAQNFGVNGKKIMSDIAKNLPKFRQMGFQGGEQSLKRMAIQAERLGQNIDEIFDVAKRARTIQGAMDMAAELQLAGGSFANINPMDLLSAARKGPEELQKILSQMGGDIGKFNAATGEMAFDAVDFDRMQMVADATGMSVDSLQKQITKTAQDNQKLSLLPPGMFDGLSPEEQAFIANSMKMKDGKLVDFGIDGVDDISKLTKEQISAAMDKANADKKTLAQQAEENMSFQESVSALKTAVMNIFTYLEPLVKSLTSFIQTLSEGLSKLPSWGKMLVAGIVGAGALLFGFAKQWASGFAFGKGQNAAMQGGGFFKSLTGMFGKGSKIPGAGKSLVPESVGKMPTGTGPGGFLGSLALGIKSFGKISPADLLKFAAAMTIIGAGLIGFTYAIASIGGEASLAQLGTAGASLVLLGGSLWLMSKLMSKTDIGGVLKGSLAMAILGLSLIPFAMAAQMFQQTDWETFAKMALVMVGGILALMGIGALLSGPQALLFIIGAAALAAAGLSLMLFGAAMNVAAGGFAKMAAIDWNSFGNMGTALMSIVPGLLALGGVGLFALPGLFMMTGVLAGLGAVMVVLAPALSMASQSMVKMAEGIDKLKEAVKGLDTAKLEDLSETAEKLASASAINALAGAINSISGGGGGGGKPQTIKIEPININLKLNGRQLQDIIVTDVQHVT